MKTVAGEGHCLASRSLGLELLDQLVVRELSRDLSSTYIEVFLANQRLKLTKTYLTCKMSLAVCEVDYNKVKIGWYWRAMIIQAEMMMWLLRNDNWQ